jgi:hypothetical protein
VLFLLCQSTFSDPLMFRPHRSMFDVDSHHPLPQRLPLCGGPLTMFQDALYRRAQVLFSLCAYFSMVMSSSVKGCMPLPLRWNCAVHSMNLSPHGLFLFLAIAHCDAI